MSLDLTIAIPTYNRLPLLRQTVESLLPQLTDSVELLVCNNDSTDGTTEYLDHLGNKIRHFKQTSNIGADGNFLSCIKIASGRYLWLLGDDDVPCVNAVSLIVKAIPENGYPGFISLRAVGGDATLNQYHANPVQTEWDHKDKNSFLFAVGEMITFGSIIVAEKKLIDTDFFESHVGTFLSPAALTLQVAGVANKIIVSTQPLVFAREGKRSGYDAYTVFSKNLSNLLDIGKMFGYQKKALDSVYRSALAGVFIYLTRVWPVSVNGMWNFLLYSTRYREFYTKFLPGLLKNILKYVKNYAFSVIKEIERLFSHLLGRGVAVEN